MTDNGKMMYDAWAESNTSDRDEILKGILKETGHADMCVIATGKPDRAASNLRERQEYYYFEGLKGWAEYDIPKPADTDFILVHIKLTTADPRPVEIYVDKQKGFTRHLDHFKSGTYGPEGLRWISLGVFYLEGGRTSVKLKIVPVGYAPHIGAIAVLPMKSQTKPSKPLPGGSWKHSARNFKVNNDGKLEAELRDMRGGWHSRVVDYRVGDEFENLNGNFSLHKIASPGKIARVYGDYEILPELDFGGKFDITNMKADDLDKVCEECQKRDCNVFVVAHGRAWLKRVLIAPGPGGRAVQSPNRSKKCTMYVHKGSAAAIKGRPALWLWNTDRRFTVNTVKAGLGGVNGATCGVK